MIDTTQAIRELQLARYRDDARTIVSSMYTDEQGNPIVLTDSQCDIFNIIAKKLYPRNHIETHTRFGKSLVTALAILTRISTYAEKWAIVAGNEKQAHIIMSYLNQHIFDNEYTKSRFVREKGETDEYILRYRNKNRINFVVGRDKNNKPLLGEVYITNASGALGFGAPNICMDESALIPDQDEALVFRMLGDSNDNFYFKIGNPFESGHFRKSFDDPDYFKIVVDCYRGIQEGRLTESLVEEARKRPFFDVLYECKFPPSDSIDDGGWMPLLTKEDIDKAIIDSGIGFGVHKLGVDVAGEGRNFSVGVHRHTNLAYIGFKKHTPDTMEVADYIINSKKKDYIIPQNIVIDKVGVGNGVFNISARELEGVVGMNVGEKPYGMDGDLYFNVRAMAYWKLREWILAGGKLVKGEEDLDNTWYQLTKIKYRKKLEGMKGKLQIMPKELMFKAGIESPDIADALSLTFTTPDVVQSYQDMEKESFDKYKMFEI